MKVLKVKVWKCSECDTIVKVEDTPPPEVVAMWECEECGERG